MEVFAVEGLPEVREGDSVADLVAERADLRDGDVVCVASTIVSKAAGRTAALADFPAGERAERIAGKIGDITGERKDPRFAQAVVEESEEILTEAPFVLAVTRFGHITVNAGIDRSNVPDADLLLLPEDPTDCAERIRAGYDDDIVTEVEPLETFYPAEEYHQDYFEKNPNQAYCQMTIPPKIEKLKQKHAELLA